ncbi:hypothetical protein Q4575_06600 [Psychrosphaera sp. 1_MG-2023]|uniref:hypothetical protein n=1 Tax=Psychrosphaera sp. 1_MG-2023 TaxID=3062643 RepID=UPI0026E267FC|nr:hypothetical protein [Psychrosphaera sp. 1_MG-2023]MDO6719064.1 hypothetical protein [Psychrosphaera sp. 1_MG-2023]
MGNPDFGRKLLNKWQSTLYSSAKFFMLALTCQLSFQAFAIADGSWVTVEEATIEQSRVAAQRRVGLYTFNNITLSGSPELSGSLRLVVTQSSHSVISPDGIDDSNNPYFNIEQLDDVTQIFFTNKRVAFSYTAELQQFVAAATAPIVGDLVLNTEYQTIPSCTPVELTAMWIHDGSPMDFPNDNLADINVTFIGNDITVENKTLNGLSGATALIKFAPHTLGTSTVTAVYTDTNGEEHTTSIDFNVENNAACDDHLSTLFTLDTDFESDPIDPLLKPMNANFGSIAISNDGIIGQAIEWSKGVNLGGSNNNNGLQYWNSNNNADWNETALFDQLSAPINIGEQVKVSAWIKVTHPSPEATKIVHTIYPEKSLSTGGIGARRNAGILLSTTISVAEHGKWVYKEFVVDATSAPSFTIPDTWVVFGSNPTIPTHMVADFRWKQTSPGAKFAIDEYAIVISGASQLPYVPAPEPIPDPDPTPDPEPEPIPDPEPEPTPDPEPLPEPSDNLLFAENMSPSSHWDRSELTNVVNSNNTQEAVATLVGAANSNVYVIFSIEQNARLEFSFVQDDNPDKLVTSWEVAYKNDSGWVVLKSWGDAAVGLNTFTANPNVSANLIRFRFSTSDGANLGISQLSVVSYGSINVPEPLPEQDPSTLPSIDTDLTGYTGYTDEFGVTTVDVGYFENKVFDDAPAELIAESEFVETVNDTARLKTALNQAKNETNGGVVRLLANENGQNRFSLSHIAVPSNVRIEVEPGVVLEMRGIKEDLYPTSANDYRNKNKPNRQFLFSFGRSNGPSNLLANRIENVEVRSTVPGEKFTIDAKTNMPHDYGYMVGGNGNGVVNLTRAIPIGLFYVKNFGISDINIVDNHTESVAIQMFADTDYQDGSYTYRFGSTPLYLQDRYVKNPEGSENLNRPMNPVNIPLATNVYGDFIDDSGEIIPDMFAIQRNPTYARTPVKGSIKNIKASHAHTGYGVVQVYGGDWIEIDNIEAFNGIGVRLEAGNGTDNDNFNRSGPYYSSMNKIQISNVKVTNGFTGVWLKPHSKIMKDITVENVEAIDSGTALLVGKGTFNCKTRCRDLTRGRINNLVIKGDITLRQTVFDKPVAEVGNNITYLITDAHRQYLANLNGKTVDQLTRGDLQEKTITGEQTPEQLALLTPDSFDNPSGTRWYKIFPTAPVLALSMLSETEVGDESAKIGFYPVDFSQANIVSDGLPADTLILYRGDMRQPNGEPASDFINK